MVVWSGAVLSALKYNYFYRNFSKDIHHGSLKLPYDSNNNMHDAIQRT